MTARSHSVPAADDPTPSDLTLGVEEEIMLVATSSSEIAPIGPALVGSMDGCRILPELRAAQVELVTPVCSTVADLEREVVAGRAALHRLALGLARPVAVAVRPAGTDPGPVGPVARYAEILAAAPWAGRELLTCGLHVHVGVRGRERRLALHDALRSYLPLLGALAANSPFHGGRDTGVASVRARLKETLPRSGVPPAFGTWERYQAFVDWGARGGVVPDGTYHWYDLRISPTHPTIEVRVCDVPTDVAHTVSLAALVQAVCAFLLARIDAGDPMVIHAGERIGEGLWLAARDGASGSLPDLDTGALIPVDTALALVLDEVGECATALGTERYLEALWEIQRLPGHERQRIVERSNGIDGLVDWLAAETIGPGCHPLPSSTSAGAPPEAESASGGATPLTSA